MRMIKGLAAALAAVGMLAGSVLVVGAQEVPGSEEGPRIREYPGSSSVAFLDVDCISEGECYIVGIDLMTDEVVVTPIIDEALGEPVVITGASDLSGPYVMLECASDFCVVVTVGYAGQFGRMGWSIVEDGMPSAMQWGEPHRALGMFGLSCHIDICAAAAALEVPVDGQFSPVAPAGGWSEITRAGATPLHLMPPVSWAYDAECFSPGNCVIAGLHGMLDGVPTAVGAAYWHVQDGDLGGAEDVPGDRLVLTSIECDGPRACAGVAGGTTNRSEPDPPPDLVRITEQGAETTRLEIQNSSTYYHDIACVDTVATCIVGATQNTATASLSTVAIRDGVPQPPRTYPGYTAFLWPAGCSDDGCVVAARSTEPPARVLIFDAEKGGDPINLGPGPIAEPDVYTAGEDAVLQIDATAGVLANDRASRPGVTLAATLAGGPAAQRVTLAPDGSFTYTPEPGFSGVDSFTYIAEHSDGTAAAPTIVTVTVIGRQATVLTAYPALLRLSWPTLIPIKTTEASALLVDAATSPVAGKVITFRAGATTLCSATTGADGVASCKYHNVLAALLAGKTTATFDGDALHEGSTAAAPLIGY
jgi:hypothetical protein